MIDCLDCFGCRLFLRQREGQEIKVTLLLMIPKCLPALVQKEVRLKLRKRVTFENILYKFRLTIFSIKVAVVFFWSV